MRVSEEKEGGGREKEKQSSVSGGTSFGGPILFFNTALPHRRYAPGIPAYVHAICIDPVESICISGVVKIRRGAS